MFVQGGVTQDWSLAPFPHSIHAARLPWLMMRPVQGPVALPILADRFCVVFLILVLPSFLLRSNSCPFLHAGFVSCRPSSPTQHLLRQRITLPIGLGPLVQRASRRSKIRISPPGKQTHRPMSPLQTPRLFMIPAKKLRVISRPRLCQMRTRTRNLCPMAGHKRMHRKESKVEAMIPTRRRRKQTIMSTRPAGDFCSLPSPYVSAYSARLLYVVSLTGRLASSRRSYNV